MCAGFSTCLRDGPACKTKWNQLIPKYKKIQGDIQNGISSYRTTSTEWEEMYQNIGSSHWKNARQRGCRSYFRRSFSMPFTSGSIVDGQSTHLMSVISCLPMMQIIDSKGLERTKAIMTTTNLIRRMAWTCKCPMQ